MSNKLRIILFALSITRIAICSQDFYDRHQGKLDRCYEKYGPTRGDGF